MYGRARRSAKTEVLDDPSPPASIHCTTRDGLTHENSRLPASRGGYVNSTESFMVTLDD